ncbi:hypothetical protein N8987_00365 [Crocinitomix sp.]|nr:hypothetical protein [Crocinitomix sp.]
MNSPGNWHNNAAFSFVHTQSTRTTDIDGGAFGGMDDRFDFIFIGEDLKSNQNGAKYINESYKVLGQDGKHFNKSLLDLPINESIPADIINKLYYMSDHLPVLLEIEVPKETMSEDQ